ncbi:MAG: hypothetical protein HKN56_08130 [Gammaproteobacteria bacterium]|nr:hypothetical protein [Gammaproteobacteria bacterium]NND54920.1 hypothetical protein [Gammaproteobacteria bacterium]
MSDSKINGFSSRLATKYEQQLSRGSAGSAAADTSSGKNNAQVGSWDAYKDWLTKVQAPDQKRSLPDPALFSFKGYRSWAEKVRRDWDADDE